MRELAVSFRGSHPVIVLINWITNRRPTAADADADGEVRLRESLGTDDYDYVSWQFVAEGAPWCHSRGWTEPESDAELLPAIAVGQTWRRRDGREVKVTYHDESDTRAPFLVDGVWYRANGKSNIHGSNPSLELIELIREATPRKFVAISVSDNFVIAAVADDGTAWQKTSGSQWLQLSPLPSRDEIH